MKVNIVSTKLIKPCTPTPPNLKNYKISFTDELSPPMNVGVLLFYQPGPITLSNLEASLAQILAQFYLLAGRYLKKDHLVDCSDQGTEFLEAEAIDIDLIDLVGTKTTDQLNDLLPRGFHHVNEAATDPLLLIQLTKFRCGGAVIGISIPHRIFDASSVGTFIAAWSTASNPGPSLGIKIRPILDSPKFFPGKNQDYGPDFQPSTTEAPKIVVKRFSFNKEAIASLRSKLGLDDEKLRFSMVHAVRAVIAKALIGLDRAKYGKWRACMIAQAVNIRKRTIPPLEKNTCGNLAVESITRCMSEDETKDFGIRELASVLGEAVDKTIADCAGLLSVGEEGWADVIVKPVANAIGKSLSGEVNVVWFSDWSKFEFYEADFGWGKPVWAGTGPMPGHNIVVLMKNKEGDGFEAWVHLNQMDMDYFEQDEEFRLFTT